MVASPKVSISKDATVMVLGKRYKQRVAEMKKKKIPFPGNEFRCFLRSKVLSSGVIIGSGWNLTIRIVNKPSRVIMRKMNGDASSYQIMALNVVPRIRWNSFRRSSNVVSMMFCC